MSEKCFNQHLDPKEAVHPGGPFMIQMLFKSPVPMPDIAWMRSVFERHLNGKVASFGEDSAVVGFAALEHLAQFKDATVPVQLMVMECTAFDGTKMDEFIVRQMWDCPPIVTASCGSVAIKCLRLICWQPDCLRSRGPISTWTSWRPWLKSIRLVRLFIFQTVASFF